MLMVAKRNIIFFINAVKVSIKCTMAYKLSFFIQVLLMIVNNLVFLVFWKVVINIDDSNLITFKEILCLWSFSTIAYGISYFFFDGSRYLTRYIITGTLDTYLLQPKNTLLNVLTSKSSIGAMGDLIYGTIIAMFVSNGNILTFIFIILLGIFSSIFFIATSVIIGSLSVWLSNTELIAEKYLNTFLVTFTIYPEKIFSSGVKILLYTIIPSAYISFLPTSLIANFDIKGLILIIFVGTIYMYIAVKIFNKAINQYSSGNSLSLRE